MVRSTLEARAVMRPFAILSQRGQLGRLADLARDALTIYGVSATRLTPLRHEHNTTFRVDATDGARYVLRVHRKDHHMLGAIVSELRWLVALRQDTALGVPEPVPSRDGDLLGFGIAAGMPAARPCVLFRWLDGRFLERGLTPRHLARVGALMARLHEHAAHWTPPISFIRSRVDHLTAEARHAAPLIPRHARASSPDNRVGREDAERAVRLVAALGSAADAATAEAAIARVWATLQELDTGPDRFGLIHADLHQENYLFARGEVRAIDFDDCGWGHYLFDLAVTLIELRHLPHYPARRAALLAGYRGVRPLPVEDERHLDTFFALRNLQLLLWALESRDHPAFRERWRAWMADEIDQLRAFLAAPPRDID
jgi:Ser/Thr protein kinase RdoA (MazF antagonist)